jgi:uncharacterized ferritin-like protein (DUF455 family)
MEIRELAERILFSPSLEEKLTTPNSFTDEHPGTPLPAPSTPARPPELLFKPPGANPSPFPGDRDLENPATRGRLLHFFANHELLATELMALVLLRFPHAPPAFRRGVALTLRDEQRHTRLYLDRLQSCGVTFGELPVSGYFWRTLAPMENPMDYVAGLSLTFEQANLDFCQHYAQCLRTAGDPDSATLLDGIVRDEIGHVAYGLKWFRRWKNPSESDWDAFCHVLRFPLSPRRARGITFNFAGRQAAGLDPDFIARLAVHAQSKGRTPSVLVFNPFAEELHARGPSFHPTKSQAALARDLATLPQCLARQDDVVLVPHLPQPSFLLSLQQAGLPLPEFVLNQPEALHHLAHRKLARLQPWAWAPDTLALLEPLLSSLTDRPPQPPQQLTAAAARISTKSWSADFLRRFLLRPAPTSFSPHHPPSSPPVRWQDLPWICHPDDAGLTATTFEQALQAITHLRQRGFARLIIKQSLGTAGRHALRLWEPQLQDTQQRWIQNALRAGLSLVIEPWRERLADFSIQLDHSPESLRLIGLTGLITDPCGRFLANTAAPDHRHRLPATVTQACQVSPLALRQFLALLDDLLTCLRPELLQLGYFGPLGIDAFAFRNSQGHVQIKPVVEINARYTMGRVLLDIMRYVAPGTHARLSLVSRSQLARLGHPDFPSYARHLASQFPLHKQGHPRPRLAQGALPLTDPHTAQTCLAVLHLHPSLVAAGPHAANPLPR